MSIRNTDPRIPVFTFQSEDYMPVEIPMAAISALLRAQVEALHDQTVRYLKKNPSGCAIVADDEAFLGLHAAVKTTELLMNMACTAWGTSETCLLKFRAVDDDIDARYETEVGANIPENEE